MSTFDLIHCILIFCCLIAAILLGWAIEQDKGKRPAKSSPAKAKPTKRRQRTRARVNGCLESQLMGMLSNDQELADRLVASSRRKYPGRSEDWHWEKTICDLERDRR